MITNTQLINIYPGELKFSLHKFSRNSDCLHAKDNQTLLTFLTIGNLSELPCLHQYQYLFNYAVSLPW